jgi:starch synthase (maltosyl-transferring)
MVRRVVFEGVEPEINSGRFPIKRIPGETVDVGADIFADGHDRLAAVLRYRHVDDSAWSEIVMKDLGNDRWAASFTVTREGRYEYTLEAWVDGFASWLEGLEKKVDAGQQVTSELAAGGQLLRAAAERATGADAKRLRRDAEILARGENYDKRVRTARARDLAPLMARYPDRSQSSTYARMLTVLVERERAGFGAWYEMFPRSAAAEAGRHGTFKDCEARLPYIAAMGFDVLYFPPLHPIGRTLRKGKGNTPAAGPDDPGSPWGIGSQEGGHKALHSALGSMKDFEHLITKAREYRIEVALDVAFQCSPDHPYVKEHPEWFRHRPDGSIQYAENPPKKYEDIYPLDLEPGPGPLWDELKSIVDFWIAHGVCIFRVDNPHTKPFAFWEWMIAAVRDEFPDVIFLAEAFTRPKIMRHLAKCGFSQSYTYFTWRNTKWELTEYFTELTQTEVREYLRPNLFTNTPDILHAYLQHGGRAAFQARVVLAATLGGSYGIYGPAFELCDNRAVPGTEEYVESEKYEIRHWDIDSPASLRPLITRLNQARRREAALRWGRSLRFCGIENEQLIAYTKNSPDLSSVVIVVVNLDPHYRQSGWIDVPVEALGIGPDESYEVEDLLADSRYNWRGRRNFVMLDPNILPAHLLKLRRGGQRSVAGTV